MDKRIGKIIAVVLVIAIIVVAVFFSIIKFGGGSNNNNFSSCIIFDEEYCSSVEVYVIEGENLLGIKIQKDINIYSPFTGDSFVYPISPVSLFGEELEALSVEFVPNPENPEDIISFTVIGAFDDNPLVGDINKGDIIVNKSPSAVKIFNEYDFIFSFDRTNPAVNYSVPDIELTNKYFSYVKFE